VLSQFAKALAAKDLPQINSVLSYVVDLIRKRTDQMISPDDFRRWLSSYPWIIVFDGLDEVPASSNRDAVLAAIRDFRIDARSANADVLTIGTTRPQGYNEDFNPDLHRHVWLAPLSTIRAMHYAERLVAVRYGNDTDRVEKILNRLSRASKNEATARLMRSPLQVTIMATLVDRMGQPPQERWNLFKEYYRVIYQREVERDIPAAAVLRDYQPNVDTIHSHVGLLLQLESERSGQTDARLSRAQFEAVVESRLREEGHTDTEFEHLKNQIIEAATDRLVFLVGIQENEVGFEIRSLQEFMAAEGLMDGSDDLVRKRLREIAPISNWRNVFLFAAGKCFVERQHLRETIHLICAELNEDSTDRTLIETLSGSRLALDLLEDGPARRQPKYAQSLARLALRLTEQPPEMDQTRLAALHEPSLNSVYQQELELRISHTDHYRKLGAWKTVLPLVEKNIKWAQILADSHWPTEPTQQFDILLACKNSIGDYLLSKLETVIPKISPLILTDPFSREPLLGAGHPDAPSWLKAVNELLFYQEFQESLSSANFRDANELFSVEFLKTVNEWAESLREMPNPSSEWVAVMASVNFSEAPSIQTLLTALLTILDNASDELKRWLVYRAPWPLASMLASSDEIGVPELKRLAETGQLGDTQVWLDAEARWLRMGFDGQDILYAARNLPFDKNVTTQGLPLRGDFSVAIKENLASVVPMLKDIYLAVIDSPLAPWLASCILFVLSSVKRNSLPIEGEVPSLEEFRKLIADAALVKDAIYLDGLELIDFGKSLTSAEVEFFDWLGTQNIDTTVEGKKNNRLSNLLADALKSAPHRLGLLRPLSWWITEETETKIPSYFLNIDDYDQKLVKQAALRIKLVQREWREEAIGDVARWCNDFIDVEEVSNPLLDVNSALPHLSRNLLPNLLLELRELLPSSQWKQEAKIVQRLNDSIRRRTSRLAEHDVWIELGLPQKLLSFLPKE